MKRGTFYLCLVLFMMGITACNDKKSAPVLDSDMTDSIEVVDTTLYGRCGDGSAMHTLELITDENDTLIIMVNTDSVMSVRGGMAVGDRMAAIVYKDEDDVMRSNMVVNLTTLLGKWVALDRSFEILEGGIVEGDTHEPHPYREWKINNGRLVLSTDTFSVYELGVDSLLLENDRGIYCYKRLR
ncbi:MAG: hypothetical protein IK124_07650 [Prevotella sp.]|nr:hypothetical protein [Prevotella sp.]